MFDLKKFVNNAIDNISDTVIFELDNQLCDLYNDIIDTFKDKSIMNVDDFKFNLKKENLLTDELEKFIDDYINNQ